jgi:parallel beta-helix repeat protein
MSPLFGRHSNSTSPRRQPRGLRRQAERATRREAARQAGRQSLDMQQLEPRLAMAINLAQNNDAPVPYVVLTADAGDSMYLSNLGNNTYAFANNSQFLDGGGVQRLDILDAQKVGKIFVTDARSFDTTDPGNTALELAQASKQEFSLEHGGLFFRPYSGTAFGKFDFSGTLVDGARQWSFRYNLTTETLDVTGTDAPRITVSSGSSGFYRFDANATGYGGVAAVISVDWGTRIPSDPYITNLKYSANNPGYDGSRDFFVNGWTDFDFGSDQYFPGVLTDRTLDQNFSSPNLFSLQPNVVGGTVGIKTFTLAGEVRNRPGVIHLDNFGDVYFKQVDAEEGTAVKMAVSRTADGPFVYYGSVRAASNLAQVVVNPPRQTVFLKSKGDNTGVIIGVSATLNTETGKLNVITNQYRAFSNYYEDGVDLVEIRQAGFDNNVNLIPARGAFYSGFNFKGEPVNPGHVSVDVNYSVYQVAVDGSGNELSSSFTIYDGHDITQRLAVDLLGKASQVTIDSPVLNSKSIELRASSIRFDAPTSAVVDPADPALDTKRASENLQITTGKIVIGNSKQSAAKAKFVSVNAVVSAQTAYDITLEGSPTESGWLYVSPTGSLAASLTTPATKSTGLVYVDARSADVVVEGLVNADKQTYLMRSDAVDTNRHYLTTTSKYTGYPVGLIRGGTVAVLLGNDTDNVAAQNPSYITLATDVDTLRVRAAHLGTFGPVNPLRYEMKINEANDITIDAIAASSLPISLSSAGAMTFKATVETRGDLSIDVAGAFAVSAPLSSSAGVIAITAGTDLTVSNSVRSGGVEGGIASPGSIVIRAGNAYATGAAAKAGGALSLGALVDANGGTVTLQANGDRTKSSVATSTRRQGDIFGGSRVRAGLLTLAADNAVDIGADVAKLSGTAVSGIIVNQTTEINSYPVLKNQELEINGLTTTTGSITVNAAADLRISNVAAGTASAGDGDLLFSSLGVFERNQFIPSELVLKQATNITLGEGVLALGDRVRLFAPTGEIFGTEGPTASWLDWTATAVPEADKLYESVARVSAYLKSGSTRSDLTFSTSAAIALEQIRTDNGNIDISSSGAMIANSVAAGGASTITLTTDTVGDISVGTLTATDAVTLASAAGIVATLSGGQITVSAPTTGSVVLKAQGDVGRAVRRLRVNADNVEVTGNDFGDPQNVRLTLGAKTTNLSVAALSSVDVNTIGLINDVVLRGAQLGSRASLALQANRNVTLAGTVGPSDGSNAAIVSLTASTGNIVLVESAASVLADAVSLTAFKSVGDANAYETVFAGVETFSLARTGPGDLAANFNRRASVKLDGISTAGGAISITNSPESVSGSSGLFVGPKGVRAGGGGSVLLNAGDRILTGLEGVGRGTIAADGRVSLKAGTSIDATTKAPILWANATESGATINIVSLSDVRLSSTIDGKSVGGTSGIHAGPSAAGDGTISLKIFGALTTDPLASITGSTASISALSGIDSNVDLAGTLIAATSAGNIGIRSAGALTVGSAGLVANGGSITVAAARARDVETTDTEDKTVSGMAISVEDAARDAFVARAVHLAVEKKGNINATIAASVLSAATFDGDISLTERDSVSIGTRGIVAKSNGGAAKGNVSLVSTRGSITTQQVAGATSGRLNGKSVSIEAASAIDVLTAADELTVTGKRGDVQVADLDDLLVVKAEVANGAMTIRSGGTVTVNSIESVAARPAVTVAAKGDVVLTLASNAEGVAQTPIKAIGGSVLLSGATISQNNADDSTEPFARASVVSDSVSLSATGRNKTVDAPAIDLRVSAIAISAVAANAGADIMLRHQSPSSRPLVLGATVNGVPSAIRAGGNVTITSSDSDIIVAAAPIAGIGKTVAISTEPVDKSVTFIVSTAADAATKTASVPGSLRDTLALITRNTAEENQGLAFASTLTSPITLNSALPAIGRRISLDGTRRFVAASNQFVTSVGQFVQIDGSRITGAADGIHFSGEGANKSSIKGFAIQGFRQGAAVRLSDVSGVTVGQVSKANETVNSLGFLRSTGAVAPNQFGVRVTSSAGKTSDGNILAGNAIGSNTVAGISLEGTGTTNTLIQKNAIGTTVARLDRGNTGNGVRVVDAGAGTVIGDKVTGTTAETSGNGNLFMFNGATDKSVATLLVSSSTTGANAGIVVKGNEFSSNRGRVVHVRGGSGAVIDRNTFTRNGEDTIVVEDTSADVKVGNSSITGNFIGTDKFGTLGLGNRGHGVRVSGGSAITIRGNTVRGSLQTVETNGSLQPDSGAGIRLQASTNFVVENNKLFANRTGIDITDGASAVPVSGNTVSNSVLHGIRAGGSAALTISRNTIELNGLNQATGSGVFVSGPAAKVELTGNAIRGNRSGRGIVLDTAILPVPIITSSALSPKLDQVTKRLSVTVTTGTERPIRNQSVWVDVYQADSTGQGGVFLDRVQVTLDANGRGTVQTKQLTGFGINNFVVLTVTDLQKRTSAFSNSVIVR